MSKRKGNEGVMAIKIDLKNAYDHLEWSFIKDVPLQIPRAPYFYDSELCLILLFFVLFWAGGGGGVCS